MDHFFSRIGAAEASCRGPVFNPGGEETAQLGREFSRLLAPVIGTEAGKELFTRTLEHIQGKTGDPRRLGSVAAFFLGDYDVVSMPLEKEDWEDIRETLEALSGEMDLPILTALMGDLLSRGKLAVQ
jgi:hypothetical protein